MVSYALWLIFQLKTHRERLNGFFEKLPKRKSSKLEYGAAERGIAIIEAGIAAASGSGVNLKNLVHKQPNEVEEFQVPNLVVSVVLVAFNT